MAINIENIQFLGILNDEENKPLSNFSIAIQFFNLQLNQWLFLTTSVEIENGKFSYLLELPDRISLTNQTVRVIREVIKMGGVPSFRLVKKESENVFTEVIASDFQVYVKDTLLQIDFGKNNLLKETYFINYKTYKKIASVFPVYQFENIISQTQLENNDLARELEYLNQKVNENEQQLLNLEDLISQYEIEIAENYKEKYFSLEKNLEVLEKQFEEVSSENSMFLEKLKSLQSEMRLLKTILDRKESELGIKQEAIQSLEKELLAVQTELEEVTVFNVTEEPNKLTASQVYTSIVKDVVKADEELSQSKFKLANVSLNLKTAVEKGPSGTILSLVGLNEANDINSDFLSTINIDVVPNVLSVSSKENKLPDLKGLTETAVRRILSEYGLKLDAVYHPTDSTEFIDGQSFKQAPVAGSSYVEGQEVIVIFSKSLN